MLTLHSGQRVSCRGEQHSKTLKAKDWNKVKIRAVGPKYTTWLQGEEVMNYKSGSAKKEGPIGIQLHGNRNMKIDFRNLTIKEL